MRIFFLLMTISIFINVNGQNSRNKIFFGIIESDSYQKNDKIISNLPYNTDGRFLQNDNPTLDNLLIFLRKMQEQKFEVEIQINYCYSNITEYSINLTESLKKSLELILKRNNITVKNIIGNGCQESLLKIDDKSYKQMGESNLIITIRQNKDERLDGEGLVQGSKDFTKPEYFDVPKLNVLHDTPQREYFGNKVNKNSSLAVKWNAQSSMIINSKASFTVKWGFTLFGTSGKDHKYNSPRIINPSKVTQNHKDAVQHLSK